ncbi:asparagine synthase (glutamine-hydrolyzing) [Catenuloplanes atrovinosus]|uniref:asparagine synthase (glutamine-hydrolyzing) n=1 Tax=Catenuloplanes atrovinosus TaxID=137266 RepID=A0AAE3YNB5_9ACTN|nr:asparagine synthase (glutamine-hydrolyzing) [Catenuloplanes atrovinosus]MDR7275657.1 asparagine synthase (glutamine-hydrolyzing) [Catenuloplanes atrovinosus]
MCGIIVWLDESIALGHRRLAVIDIPGGTQPMTVRRDGTVTAVITYSGEVYNFRELRTELRGHGHPFRTDSDTEVLLRAYLQWGDQFVERLRGIFAFGLWDHAHQRLILGRDRIGVKPLYYRPTPHGLLFASEPKGILAHPAVTAEVDPDGLRELLTHFTSPGRTPYRDMYDVRPGQLVIADRTGVRHQRYWSLHTEEHPDDLPTTVRTVRQLLQEAVTEQLIADVPLCTLLSGGLDSSTLTAIAAGPPTSGPRIRTCAIDFAGQTENFRPDAVRDAPDTPLRALQAMPTPITPRDCFRLPPRARRQIRISDHDLIQNRSPAGYQMALWRGVSRKRAFLNICYGISTEGATTRLKRAVWFG